MAMRTGLCVALLTAFASAGAVEVTPVEKVLTMLEDLQTQVIMEGKAEAKSYDKFACFCKDLSDQKSSDITDATDQAASLTGAIETLSTDRQELTDENAELNAKIATLTAEMEAATAKRKKENEIYVHTEAELHLSVEELKEARDSVKGGMLGLTQLPQALQKVAHTVEERRLLSKERHERLMAALLDDTERNSGDIIATIEEILADMEQQLQDCRDTEDKRVKAYKELMVTKTEEKTEAEDDVTKNSKIIGAKSLKISTNQNDLTLTNAQLAEDKAYLTEVSTRCNAKSNEWDQRSTMRSDEITALTTAIHIIAGKVKEKTTEKTVRLLQVKKPKPAGIAPATVAKDAEETTEDEVDDIMTHEPMFLQLAKPRAHLAALARKAPKLQKFLGGKDATTAEARRQKVMTLLKAKSAELKSTTLSALATQIAVDPFVKIRKLIQELVERLLQEAADEGNHKGWCDKEIGKAEQKRDTQADEIKTLNEALASDEAKRDLLTMEMAKLDAEMIELKAVMEKTMKERNEEKAENEATIQEAEEGKAAVDEAIDVLSKFYKTAAKAELVQVSVKKGVDEDMPDTGFEGSYKASQGAATGIMGMMDVILSDFVRTMETTAKEEKEAAAAFFEFETATKVALGKKKVGFTERETEKEETIDQISENTDSLNEEQAIFDKALQELLELQPACVDTGMSYEERVAKREQEIESLKEALCILDKEGPVQTEPGCE